MIVHFIDKSVFLPDYSVDSAEKDAQAMYKEMLAGAAALKAAEAAHDGKAALIAGADMSLTTLKMTKFGMFVLANKQKLQKLVEKSKEKFGKFLKETHAAMKAGIDRFPKDDPLVGLAGDLVTSQVLLLEEYIKALEGNFLARVKFFSQYKKNFQHADEKFLKMIKDRVQSKGKHIASLMPFMVMAQAERVAITFYMKKGQDKLESLVKERVADLRKMAKSL